MISSQDGSEESSSCAVLKAGSEHGANQGPAGKGGAWLIAALAIAGLSSHRAHCVSSPDHAQSVVAASNDETPALPMCRAPQVDSGGRYTPLTPRPPPILTLHLRPSRFPGRCSTTRAPSRFSNTTFMSPSHSGYHTELPRSLLIALVSPASSSRLATRAALVGHRRRRLSLSANQRSGQSIQGKGTAN